MRTRRVQLAFLIVLAALLGAVGVGRAAETITAIPDSFEYSKPTFTQNQGERSTFAGDSEGGVSHNVTAERRGPDGGRLFRSKTIRSGTTPVEGTQYLKAGNYVFVCTVHFGMDATLVVSAEGTPKARPRVVLGVLRQSLAYVKKTGRLKVRLRSPTGAKNVVVIARGAGLRLARENGLDVARGGTRVVALRLGNRARAAIANRKSLKVSSRGKVSFGAPAAAQRTLRGG